MSDVTALRGFSDLLIEHVGRLVADNAAPALLAADLIVKAQRSGHLIWAAGAGHSLGGVLEMFYRAGGLPDVVPLWHPEILPLHGAALSTAAERRVGLGAAVAAAAPLSPGDVVVVYSSSGINPYPVEVAAHGQEVGASVIAVTSRAAGASAPRRDGRRLADLADVVLDTGAPPGDVTWPASHPQVAPLSSIANAVCWNMVMVAAMDLEPKLLTWISANTGATEDHNNQLRELYGARISAL